MVPVFFAHFFSFVQRFLSEIDRQKPEYGGKEDAAASDVKLYEFQVVLILQLLYIWGSLGLLRILRGLVEVHGRVQNAVGFVGW